MSNFENLHEKSPEGWTGTVRAMKTKHPELNKGKDKNPYALANYMKKKGDKPHYKDQESSLEGKPEKKEKYKDEDEKDKKKDKKKDKPKDKKDKKKDNPFLKKDKEDKKEWTLPTWQEWVANR